MTTLKRNHVDELKPGEYMQVLKNHLYGDIVWCNWVCPKCNTPLSIGRKFHDVSYLGVVTPRVSCPRVCGFVDWVTLEDWIPEALGLA